MIMIWVVLGGFIRVASLFLISVIQSWRAGAGIRDPDLFRGSRISNTDPYKRYFIIKKQLPRWIMKSAFIHFIPPFLKIFDSFLYSRISANHGKAWRDFHPIVKSLYSGLFVYCRISFFVYRIPSQQGVICFIIISIAKKSKYFSS